MKHAAHKHPASTNSNQPDCKRKAMTDAIVVALPKLNDEHFELVHRLTLLLCEGQSRSR